MIRDTLKKNAMKKIDAVEGIAADMTHGALKLKETVSDAIEDAVDASKDIYKRGYNTAEDLVDRAARQVKRHPLTAVGIALGSGALIGWLVTRNGTRNGKR